MTKQDYLNKSSGQKTAAWILLGVGASLIAIAAPGNVDFDVLPVLAIGAGAAIIGSITLFISSGKNKRRAMSMAANFQLQQNSLNAYTIRSQAQFQACLYN